MESSTVLKLVVHEPSSGGLTFDSVQRMLDLVKNKQNECIIALVSEVDGTFCQGLNLSEITSSRNPEVLTLLWDLMSVLRSCACPVIALVDGEAKGGGVGLLAVADIVLATERATFSLPESLMGLIPAVIFPFVSERLGRQLTQRLAMTGLSFSTDDALKWGLVDEKCEDLAAATKKTISRLMKADPRAISGIKYLSTRSGFSREYFDIAFKNFSELLSSEQTISRINKFNNGEAPWG